MSVEVVSSTVLTVKETVTTNVDGVSSPVVTHDTLNFGSEHNASSSVPASQVSSGTVTLSAGAATLNLAALPGFGGSTVNLTGLKVQFVMLYNPSANAITLVPGASNGIDLFGTAFSITVGPGQRMKFELNEQAPDVASGDRTIDFTGTGSQTLRYQIVAG